MWGIFYKKRHGAVRHSSRTVGISVYFKTEHPVHRVGEDWVGADSQSPAGGFAIAARVRSGLPGSASLSSVSATINGWRSELHISAVK